MPEEIGKKPEIPRPEIPKPEIKPEKPEAAPEAAPEAPKEIPAAETAPPAAPPAPAPAAPVLPAKDPEVVAIENLLSAGLDDLFRKMPPELQKEFQAKGEETASKIKQMIDTAKLKAKSVLELIKDWLKLIPSVNHFFLEQEAKIKTDKVMEYSEKKKV